MTSKISSQENLNECMSECLSMKELQSKQRTFSLLRSNISFRYATLMWFTVSTIFYSKLRESCANKLEINQNKYKIVNI